MDREIHRSGEQWVSSTRAAGALERRLLHGTRFPPSRRRPGRIRRALLREPGAGLGEVSLEPSDSRHSPETGRPPNQERRREGVACWRGEQTRRGYVASTGATPKRLQWSSDEDKLRTPLEVPMKAKPLAYLSSPVQRGGRPVDVL